MIRTTFAEGRNALHVKVKSRVVGNRLSMKHAKELHTISAIGGRLGSDRNADWRVGQAIAIAQEEGIRKSTTAGKDQSKTGRIAWNLEYRLAGHRVVGRDRGGEPDSLKAGNWIPSPVPGVEEVSGQMLVSSLDFSGVVGDAD